MYQVVCINIYCTDEQQQYVCSAHYPIPGTIFAGRHPAQKKQRKRRLFNPTEIQALWSRNYDTKIPTLLYFTLQADYLVDNATSPCHRMYTK